MPQRSYFSLKKSKEPQKIFVGKQFQGKRKRQEDHILVLQNDCCAIADGVGGSPFGSEASDIAVKTSTWYYRLAKHKPRSFQDAPLLAKRITEAVQRAILKEKGKKNIKEGLFTTLSFLWFSAKKIYILHVGDGRIYRIREQTVQQLTPTHRNTFGSITEFFGDEEHYPHPFYWSDTYNPSEKYLLVTDGIGDWLREDDILSLGIYDIHKQHEREAYCQMLIDRSISYGSEDNLSVVFIDIE